MSCRNALLTANPLDAGSHAPADASVLGSLTATRPQFPWFSTCAQDPSLRNSTSPWTTGSPPLGPQKKIFHRLTLMNGRPCSARTLVTSPTSQQVLRRSTFCVLPLHQPAVPMPMLIPIGLPRGSWTPRRPLCPMCPCSNRCPLLMRLLMRHRCLLRRRMPQHDPVLLQGLKSHSLRIHHHPSSTQPRLGSLQLRTLLPLSRSPDLHRL